MKYAMPLISLITVSSTIYAFSIETDPHKIIEKENRDAILECLENVYTANWSSDMKKQIRFCESLPLLSITWTLATGSIVAPSRTVEEAKERFNHAKLYQDVCKKQINSPLCKNRALFDRLYQITEERLPWKNFYPILLGITNAESSLGLAYAKDNIGWTCADRNNWGWIKWKINDDGTRQKDQPIPDQYGCYLYRFDSIEDYWISKVNTVRFWYKWCVDHKTPIRCMSYAYVGNRYVAEESWIKNVSIFLN